MSQAHWYAVMTRPTMEHAASVELKRLGMHVFYPFSRVRRKKRVRGTRNKFIIDWVTRPYFSRYIFVLATDEQVPAVNDAQQVSTIVYLGGVPCPIPDLVIDRMMALTDEQGLVGSLDLASRVPFKAGDEVRFDGEHAFAGLVAQVSVDAGKEVEVWLDFLGSRRTLRVDPELLQVVRISGVDEAAIAA